MTVYMKHVAIGPFIQYTMIGIDDVDFSLQNAPLFHLHRLEYHNSYALNLVKQGDLLSCYSERMFLVSVALKMTVLLRHW